MPILRESGGSVAIALVQETLISPPPLRSRSVECGLPFCGLTAAGCPSEEFGCGQEIATLVAMLQVDRVLQKPRGGTALLKARVAHRTFEVSRPTRRDAENDLTL